jgi:enoyl-CoA hydratase
VNGQRSPLSVDVAGEVALVTLDRPEKRNALSLELRDELTRAFEALGTDKRIGCIVLTGAGSAFCAGMDRTQFGGDRINREHIVRASIAALRAISRCPKPTIAAVNGPALGGGFALALLCDLLVASDAARFGFAEVALGIPAAYAAARASMPAPLARELALTGREMTAKEAFDCWVASEVVPTEQLLPRATELARTIARLPRGGILHTAQRIVLERETVWAPLFEEEEQALRTAVLEDQS